MIIFIGGEEIVDPEKKKRRNSEQGGRMKGLSKEAAAI